MTPDADQTDYEAAIKVNRTTGCGNFDFSKETHPLSLMVYDNNTSYFMSNGILLLLIFKG